MSINREFIKQLYNDLEPSVKAMVDRAVDRIVETKKRKGNVLVVTGSAQHGAFIGSCSCNMFERKPQRFCNKQNFLCQRLCS